MDAGGNFNQPKPSTEVLHKFQDTQKWWQSQQAQRGFVHLTGKTDRVTSVAIPLAMATVGGFMVLRALHNLYTGQGKGDQ
jgi:hypothetical protein